MEAANQNAAVYTDPKASREYLTALGIDAAGLSDDQAKSLAFMGWYQDRQNEINSPVTPPPASAGDMVRYMEQAQRELGPTYANDFETAKMAIKQNLGAIIGNAKLQETQREITSRQEKETLAGQMADAGTAYGDLRKRAEATLQRSQGAIVKSEASELARKMREQAQQYERTYGQRALADLKIPELHYAGVKVQQYEPLGTAEGFGTRQIEQKTAEIGRQQDIMSAEQQWRQDELTYSQNKPL